MSELGPEPSRSFAKSHPANQKTAFPQTLSPPTQLDAKTETDANPVLESEMESIDPRRSKAGGGKCVQGEIMAPSRSETFCLTHKGGPFVIFGRLRKFELWSPPVSENWPILYASPPVFFFSLVLYRQVS